mmetsp:Transcript_8305/g.16890  ORF Transcript_8305/g.16890 Transcript_8305/m.16890 type:complete len:91 (+) Transcript_8305:91-363(+)
MSMNLTTFHSAVSHGAFRSESKQFTGDLDEGSALELNIHCDALPNMDVFSKSDPFAVGMMQGLGSLPFSGDILCTESETILLHRGAFGCF